MVQYWYTKTSDIISHMHHMFGEQVVDWRSRSVVDHQWRVMKSNKQLFKEFLQSTDQGQINKTFI